MSDSSERQPPDAVVGIVRAMVHQALARCDRSGIEWAEFYRVMREEQAQHPHIPLPELFERVFSRLELAN